MKEWICSLKRKKHQKEMNKEVRILNKNLELDHLWQGRFYVRQIDSPQFYIYEDKSGADLYVHFRVFDKVTGKTKDSKWETVNHWLRSVDMFWFVNNFIIEDVKVWEEDWLKNRGKNDNSKND